MQRVLILAAHPDDEILGCGGFISKYINRHVKVNSSVYFRKPIIQKIVILIEKQSFQNYF